MNDNIFPGARKQEQGVMAAKKKKAGQSGKKALSTSAYKGLVKNISDLYSTTVGGGTLEMNRRQTGLYWHIGQMIFEVEQDYKLRADYGSRLIERLSRDLNGKFNRGFSERNLQYMRRFHCEYEIPHICAELSWSHYRALLNVKDRKKRARLEKRAVKEKLSNTALMHLVRLARQEESGVGKSSLKPALTRPEGTLFVYKVVRDSFAGIDPGQVAVDVGFEIVRTVDTADYKKVKAGDVVLSRKHKNKYNINRLRDAEGRRFTYLAHIERVVDGDTINAWIDCGFNTFTRQSLRLRGIDAPELGTRAGDRARDFVAEKLKYCRKIAVKTYGSDKYDRYLVDVIYKPREKDPALILEKGSFLNQELIEGAYAVIN